MSNETLAHDPRTKQQIKDLLYAFLYEPVQRQFKQRLNVLITRNTAITGASHSSFTYKGNFYSNDQSSPPRKLTRLVPQLYPEMDAYLAELKHLNDREVPYVLGFITKVLNSSNDLHDYLRVFPNSIHRPIEQLIASCPCRTKRLSDEEVSQMQASNQQSIDMLRQRMVTNLII